MSTEFEAGFSRIQRHRLTDATVDQIERLIIEGRFEPGQRLPAERDLGAMLGVSRPTLREAIRALTMMGILEARQGAGTYVRNPDAATLFRPTRVLLAREGGRAWLIEVRRMLEGGAADLAAVRATPTERDQIEAWLAGDPGPHADVGVLRKRDLQFHSMIIPAAHNPLLSTIIASLMSLLLESRAITGQNPDWERAGVIHLRDTAEAILGRDRVQARLAMNRHLDAGEYSPGDVVEADRHSVGR